MANLTPEEYVKIQFSDTYDTYDIIRIVRIHSPNSHWKKNAQVFLWIIKIGKKDIYTSVFLTTDYESDGLHIRKIIMIINTFYQLRILLYKEMLNP